MKKMIAAAAAAALVLAASTAYAGGPVIVEEEVEVVAEKPASSVGWVPLLIGAAILCVAFCGGSDDDEATPAADPAPVEPVVTK